MEYKVFSSFSYSKVSGVLENRQVNTSVSSFRFNLNNNINLTDSFTIQLVGFYQTKQNLNNGGVMKHSHGEVRFKYSKEN